MGVFSRAERAKIVLLFSLSVVQSIGSKRKNSGGFATHLTKRGTSLSNWQGSID